MTPEQARAAAAIAYTQSVYATGGDRGRLEFHGHTHRGHGAIAAALGERTDTSGGFVRHHLTTRRIEFVGPYAADAWTCFLVMTPAGPDHCGRYVDHFVRAGERRPLARRRVTLDWAAPDSRQSANVDK